MPSRSRRLPIHHWCHCTWGKRSEAARARGGWLAQRTRPGPPHQGCRQEPPQECSSLEGVGTCWEGPSREEERGNQQRGRREPLHHCGWRQSPGEEGSRQTRLWWRSRRARGEVAVPRKQRGGKGHSGDTPRAGGRDRWGDFTRGRGPPSSRPPTGGRERSQVATGVGAAAGEVRDGRQGELRAQPPDPPGNGFCLRYACGVLCRGGQPWCSRGTAWRGKCSPSTH